MNEKDRKMSASGKANVTQNEHITDFAYISFDAFTSI
jgi:hypothetical protein